MARAFLRSRFVGFDYHGPSIETARQKRVTMGLPSPKRTHATYPRQKTPQGKIMSIGTILLIVLILMLVGAFPSWPHSRSWGYGPSAGIGLVALIVVILLVLGRS